MDLHDPPGLRGHLRIVGDDDHRMPLIPQLVQDRHDLFPGVAVQRPGRFIGKDHLPAVHQRPGDTHPLLLATGELRRLVIDPLPQPQPGKQRLRPLKPFFALHAGIDRRHFDVLRRAQVREQVVTLEDKAEMFPPQFGQRVAVEGGDIGPGHPVRAAGGFIQTAKNIHQGGFTGARGPDNRYHLPGLDPQGDAFQHLHRPVAGGVAPADIIQLQQGRHLAAPGWLSLMTTSSPSSSPFTTTTSVSLRAPRLTSRSRVSPLRSTFTL